jgi:hypothetical protein
VSISKKEFEEIMFVEAFVDLIGCSMATYVVVEDKIPEWKDWLRTRILAESDGSEPEVSEMYQAMVHAPRDVVEQAIQTFVHKCRENARILKDVQEELANE